MKKYIHILMVVIFSSNLYCQDAIEKEQKSIITFSAFTPVLNQAPRWTAGYMHKLKKRFWIGASIGFGLKKISILSSEGSRISDQDYKLYEIRPELYFDLNVADRARQFISFELFYIIHKDKYVDGFYRDITTKQEFNFDNADYKRVKTGFNINYNFIIPIFNRFSLMQKIGVGYKHRNVTYSNIQNLIENVTPSPEQHDEVKYLIRYNGATSALHFNLDLQLLYKF